MPVVVYLAEISTETLKAIEPPNYGLLPMLSH